MNFALVKVLECGKVKPFGSCRHRLKDVVANCEVKIGIADGHLEYPDNLALCISEHTAHSLIVHAGPSYLFHALYIHAIYIYVGCLAEKVCHVSSFIFFTLRDIHALTLRI